MNIHLQQDNVRFSLFTTDEIKRMSVMQIVTPLMLDALGHPIAGGLYDKRLGPISDQGDACGTCAKTMTNCPGHFGYIELPLPVVNPLFHKIIGTLIKISCLHCYQVQIPIHIKRTLTIQLKLLNCGLLTESMNVEGLMMELIAVHQSYENITEESIQPILKYEQLADDMIEKQGNKASTQNIETLRNQLINNLLRNIKTKEYCMYCKKRLDRIQTLRNKIILHAKIQDKNASGDTSRLKAVESKYINPEESREYMRKIWSAEKDFLQHLLSVLQDIKAEHPTDVFFFEVIPVPPSNLRPINMLNGRVLESKQSHTYKTILQNVILLYAIIKVVQKKGDLNALASAEAKAAYSYARGNSSVEKLVNCWDDIQSDVNGILDRDSHFSKEGEGLKQIIEKKEGIIRMNMMGKRVNFSARSVITPDPNLNIDEIGIPEEFAKRLTYPVAVTPWNVEELRKMVLNGPNVHPGATMIEYNGLSKRINPNNKFQQKSLLKLLLTPDDREKGSGSVKIVHRHLINGDILLLNRQPTLHKPSIMAHKARILRGEKTLRLHYANCKAYNADFDGDEMNAHFAQNELARSEGYNIVNVSNQYLVPKDGTPLSGLIQDHMISGVRLSLRGRFFTKEEYYQLVYQALSYKTKNITLLPPAIIKPRYLWSGKQILSTVIINIIPEGKGLINLISTSKIPAKAWQSGPSRLWKAGGTPFENPNTMSEVEVVIRNGELLVGILDKTHYGATPYGLVHCMYELYGGACSTRLLSSLAKLFTRFLQQEGFTLGVRDILTVKKADGKRKKIIQKAREIGIQAVTEALDIPIDTPVDQIVEEIEKTEPVDPKIRAAIDRQYKSALDGYTNAINKACLPDGLVCKFPENNLQLMVLSGAKGSTVNTMQISCLLGQIELEGKRPPVMISGKSLPSFPAFEFSPRAGGFIDGRFMTGIQPQEFFFHCMAGREGLIDTAVKTSRSGYLQRCLIKHLEGLRVSYDQTVRNSDKSVIQFLYGEDGMDISKAQFFNKSQLQFLCDNTKTMVQADILEQLKSDEQQPFVDGHVKRVKEWKEAFGSPLVHKRKSPFTLFSKYVKGRSGGESLTKDQIVNLWREIDDKVRASFIKPCVPCPDPVASAYQPDANFGAVNERIEQLMEEFQPFRKKKSKREFHNTMKLKTMQSMCPPGEPVGLLAAQSIGEPSTQMTLNTFHFAGRGEMNVTLGIPRLREILMMASKNIKTPSMEIPFLSVPKLEERATTLRKLLTRVAVADVLEKIDVTTKLQVQPIRQHQYILRFSFLPKKYYSLDYCVKPKMILQHMKKRFFADMFNAIRKFTKINSNVVVMSEKKNKRSKDQEDEDPAPDVVNPGNDSESEDEVEDEEDAKLTSKHQDTKEDQEPEDEEKIASEEEESDGENNVDNSIAHDTSVTDSYNYAQNYTEDKEKHLWCELTFGLPLNYKKLDLSGILKDLARKSTLWETPQIKRAITYMKDDRMMLRTDGINIIEMFKYHNLLDLQRLYCNDVHKIAETYGIEAATKCIVKEVKDVFNVYGIKVDPRHLSLIADYMTFNGTFEPLNRKGMESSASPLQQISFESSLMFLKNALLRGKEDDLENPSSSLMLGKPSSIGTGAFGVIHKIPTLPTK